MENIVIISHHLGGIGGVQKFIALIAKQFSKDGHNVLVIGCAVPKGFVRNSEPLVNEAYETVLLYEEDIFTTSPHKLFMDAMLTKKSAKYIQKRINELSNPIIIVVNPLSYVFLKDVVFKKAKKVIGQIHTSTDFILYKKGIFRAYKFFVKKYYKKIDNVLMLTDTDAKQLAKKFQWTHVRHIDNPLPYSITSSECSKLNSNKVVMLGRLDENKQISHAISAFSKVVEKYNDWELLIYGEGEKRKELEKQIDDLKMGESIKLCGKTTNPTQVYVNATITLLTSQKEGVPMALLESMSYGVPVISYNCSPGVENLVTNKTGILVENGNIDKLEKAILCLIEDESLIKSKGKEGYRSVQKFSVRNISEKWYKLFE